MSWSCNGNDFGCSVVPLAYSTASCTDINTLYLNLNDTICSREGISSVLLLYIWIFIDDPYYPWIVALNGNTGLFARVDFNPSSMPDLSAVVIQLYDTLSGVYLGWISFNYKAFYDRQVASGHTEHNYSKALFNLTSEDVSESSSQSISQSISESMSSSSSFSGSLSSSSEEITPYGLTYYSEFKDVNSINNPLSDNDTKMQYLGFLKDSWERNDLDFDYFGYGLKKTTNNRGLIFCDDASKLFSIEEGYVGMLLSLPYGITNGVYVPLAGDTSDLNKYILWGVNVGISDVSQPSLYAALTPNGIQFRTLSASADFSIYDVTTTISANQNIFIEFLWDTAGLDFTEEKTMIKINGVETASGNNPLSSESLSNLNFCALDTPFLKSGLQCTIKKLVTHNRVPSSLMNASSESSSSGTGEVTDHYEAVQGLMVISSGGSQKATNDLSAHSETFYDIYNSTSNTKSSIDSCWTTGNIYYANYDEGYVRNIKYNRDLIASLSLTNPKCLSVIQSAVKMKLTNYDVNGTQQEDLGCWICDQGSGEVIKTDNELNILNALSSINNPSCVAADIDFGCFVADDATGFLIKLSSSATVLGVLAYSSFNPPITTVQDIKTYRDTANKAWLLANDHIYNLAYSNGAITQISNTDVSSSSSLSSEDMLGHIGSIDIDRNTNYLYVCGGNNSEGWITKYDTYGNRIGGIYGLNISFPYIIKVVQVNGSSCLYVLSDPSKWDGYDYDSSSSSSNSSSSSSSYIENWSSSSSFSSSSSSGGCCLHPSCTNGVGTPCAAFSNWTFSGMNVSNTDACKLYVTISHAGTGLHDISLSNGVITVAHFAASDFGPQNPATITSVGGSGLTGSVVYSGALLTNGNTFTLEC